MEENNPVDISNLPKEIYGGRHLRNYHGFWYQEGFLSGAIAVQQRFKPRPTDILLASTPKSGTTWLKALLFATIARKHHDPSEPNHPLLFSHPREHVTLLEEAFLGGRATGSEMEALPSPRLLSTHMPYQHLPNSVTDSPCKIVYICRDPKDTVVSSWYFVQAMTGPCPLGGAFEMCCGGISPFGPMWDHWLGYWKESLRTPSKVLFLKYEDMIRDGEGNLKRLAEFVGCPFDREEEREGVVAEVVRLCSFQKLSGLEVNKTGGRELTGVTIKNSSYFRKGKVGDWRNHLTDEMARRLDRITDEKLCGSGLCFRSSAQLRTSDEDDQ